MRGPQFNPGTARKRQVILSWNINDVMSQICDFASYAYKALRKQVFELGVWPRKLKALSSIPSTKKEKIYKRTLKIVGLVEWLKQLEHLPNKCEALSSNSSEAKKRILKIEAEEQIVDAIRVGLHFE
jgi:hypothetical protein